MESAFAGQGGMRGNTAKEHADEKGGDQEAGKAGLFLTEEKQNHQRGKHQARERKQRTPSKRNARPNAQAIGCREDGRRALAMKRARLHSAITMPG